MSHCRDVEWILLSSLVYAMIFDVSVFSCHYGETPVKRWLQAGCISGYKWRSLNYDQLSQSKCLFWVSRKCPGFSLVDEIRIRGFVSRVGDRLPFVCVLVGESLDGGCVIVVCSELAY